MLMSRNCTASYPLSLFAFLASLKACLHFCARHANGRDSVFPRGALHPATGHGIILY